MRRPQADPADQQDIAGCAAYWPVTCRAPYGYQVAPQNNVDALVPDLRTAPVVRRIFEAYAAGCGLQMIAEQLTAGGVLSPSAYDPHRNPHYAGRAWSKAAVRAIITNQRYAAPAVHVQPDDCATCQLRCATRHQVALISAELYRQTQERLARHHRTPAPDGRTGDRDSGRYLLRGRLRCGLCHRLMQGTWNNRTAYYRCRFPREYARANQIDHPPNVYLREDRLVEPLRDWICRALPARMREWANRQEPAAWRPLIERADTLRRLVGTAAGDRGRCTELFDTLRIRLAYRPDHRSVEVCSEVLSGVVIVGTIRSSGRHQAAASVPGSDAGSEAGSDAGSDAAAWASLMWRLISATTRLRYARL